MLKKTKIIITLISIFLISIISTLAIFFYVDVQVILLQNNIPIEQYQDNIIGDKIHFLKTGGSDAILIESNGHFALVDCAEDSDNPRNFKDLDLTGYEEYVLSYLKENATNNEGKVVLDFVLGTHAHSDHIGGFDTLISDEDVIVSRAYLKEYNSSIISAHETEEWDNQEVYDQMVNALTEKNIEIISDIGNDAFLLGNFSIAIYNGEREETLTNIGENDNSLGVLISKGNERIFLSGDINNINGDEDRLAGLIGDINLLKLGHHGYTESSSDNYIKTLRPNIAIATNSMIRISRVTKKTLCKYDVPLYDTESNGGIVALINDEEITLYAYGD